jgi:hypothetical protein
MRTPFTKRRDYTRDLTLPRTIGRAVIRMAPISRRFRYNHPSRSRPIAKSVSFIRHNALPVV